jgi:ABC-type nitrate/sulfonate/bicarbonate transport system permease component
MENPLLLPAPWHVAACWISLASQSAFWQTVLVSIGRILLGVLWAVVLGLVLAVATFKSRLLEALVELYNEPIAALIEDSADGEEKNATWVLS